MIACIGAVLLLIQILVVIAGFVVWSIFISDDGKHIANLFSLKPFHFESVKGIIEASSLAIFSFLGFDAVTTLPEESVNPRKDIPRAMLAIFINMRSMTMLCSTIWGVIGLLYYFIKFKVVSNQIKAVN